ncbi:hypothetical protein [Limnoglobus roseus]|uniref:Uncharacterized protein n=1 Tax=Limnoglobus roseus TaxID=2598579 RepID=A0A5C1ANG1_9BACT|nr:hypothetical protein [Limnoglobus roseus]QEL19272.1 hypothetical protein PX52LOC_06334 [Limnoglobus roseus]
MPPTTEVILPEPDVLRSRIEGLDSEANQLRKLLRLVLRIRAGQSDSTSPRHEANLAATHLN